MFSFCPASPKYKCRKEKGFVGVVLYSQGVEQCRAPSKCFPRLCCINKSRPPFMPTQGVQASLNQPSSTVVLWGKDGLQIAASLDLNSHPVIFQWGIAGQVSFLPDLHFSLANWREHTLPGRWLGSRGLGGSAFGRSCAVLIWC